MTAPLAKSASEERSTLPLKLLQVFAREKPGCYPELDFKGLCTALDIAISRLEADEPKVAERLNLGSDVRHLLLEVCIRSNGNVVSLSPWRDSAIVRFKPMAGQTILKILQTSSLDHARKVELEKVCEEARAIYRMSFDPPEDG